MIVPFRGTETELAETVSRLARVRHNPCDQIILVWNSADPPPPLVHHPEWLQICVASAEASSYSARNVGVAASESDWLLFIDADCSPNPEILDLYFPIGERSDEVGIVAGGIVGAPGSTVVERYACAREHLDQRHTLKLKPIGYGQTANLLMRARVWRALGGFAEGITSGGDADFCWRAQLAGIKLEYEPAAVVEHQHRQSVKALWSQYQRYGRGQRWLHDRFGDTWAERSTPSSPSQVAQALMKVLRSGPADAPRFLLLDAVVLAALRSGSSKSNTAPLLPASEQPAVSDYVERAATPVRLTH